MRIGIPPGTLSDSCLLFSQVNKCRPLANIVFIVRPELAGGRGSDWWLWQRHAQTFIPGHRWTGSGTHPSLSQIPLPDIIEILLVRYPSLLVLHNAHVYRPHINIQYVGNVNNYVIVHIHTLNYTWISSIYSCINMTQHMTETDIQKLTVAICTVWLRSKFYRAGHAAML